MEVAPEKAREAVNHKIEEERLRRSMELKKIHEEHKKAIQRLNSEVLLETQELAGIKE